jgi:hypothetical protein
MSRDPHRKRRHFAAYLLPFVFKAIVGLGQLAILVWRMFHQNE